mmetsp:Transcript_78461/g.221844  ORF Transcript_78461/g.221844 Transcript_78461/m.221844 type:complete len:302 (+) Transcript_78461:679-1584(+)
MDEVRRYGCGRLGDRAGGCKAQRGTKISCRAARWCRARGGDCQPRTTTSQKREVAHCAPEGRLAPWRPCATAASADQISNHACSVGLAGAHAGGAARPGAHRSPWRACATCSPASWTAAVPGTAASAGPGAGPAGVPGARAAHVQRSARGATHLQQRRRLPCSPATLCASGPTWICASRPAAVRWIPAGLPSGPADLQCAAIQLHSAAPRLPAPAGPGLRLVAAEFPDAGLCGLRFGPAAPAAGPGAAHRCCAAPLAARPVWVCAAARSWSPTCRSRDLRQLPWTRQSCLACAAPCGNTSW